MNRVIKELLSIKFKDANIENLLQVIEATPNSVVATEIMCGLFEMPVIKQKPDMSVFKPRYTDINEVHNPVYTKYDPFSNEVHYKYHRRRVITFYVKQEESETPKPNPFTFDRMNAVAQNTIAEIGERIVYKGAWIKDYLNSNDIPKDDPERGEHMWVKHTVFGEPETDISRGVIDLSKWQEAA